MSLLITDDINLIKKFIPSNEIGEIIFYSNRFNRISTSSVGDSRREYNKSVLIHLLEKKRKKTSPIIINVFDS